MTTSFRYSLLFPGNEKLWDNVCACNRSWGDLTLSTVLCIQQRHCMLQNTAWEREAQRLRVPHAMVCSFSVSVYVTCDRTKELSKIKSCMYLNFYECSELSEVKLCLMDILLLNIIIISMRLTYRMVSRLIFNWYETLRQNQFSSNCSIFGH